MEQGKAFIIDAQNENFKNIHESNDCTFNYTKTNFWTDSFSAPEISSDFELLHNDLTEIKQLLSDIKNTIKDLFNTFND